MALADTEGAKHEGEVSSGAEASKHERLHELAQLAISESEVAISESEVAARRKSGAASLGQLASPQPPAQSPQSPQSAGAEEGQGEEDMHQMAIEELKRRHDAEVQGEM